MDAIARNEAIEMACSNLLMAGHLRPEPQEIIIYMAILSDYSDNELAKVLFGSGILYGKYLETKLSMN